ncbi:MAG TPA: 16S rRNA (cytosine(967)-C(5))-methyltransferase RsmB [Solirubrobacteraceae bacterium]|nr:16S rRNA (cytosine(967)-C(5))-methyltransferase RsmB [Solirubrobacteraceae bacterium]
MPATSARGRVSPARACALRVIRRVFEQGAYADRAFAGEAVELEPRDRALAMALSYGTVQRRATVDYVAEQLLDRRLNRLEPAVLAALRLGLFELLFMGGTASHAAVNESVELAKRGSRGGAGLVNAVLRRAIREGPGILAGLGDETPEAAAVLHSVPGWLASQWWSELGPEEARALLEVVNQPAESALRVNTLVATTAEVAGALPVAARPAPGIPEGLVLEGPFDVQGSELWRGGAVQPQSRASMLVSRILLPEPGQRVLDLCAAPGAKTTHLAALMGDRGEIVAVERHPGRAAALERSAARLRAQIVAVHVGDAAQVRPDGPFDRVLVDPPCSGLGTLQSRPDLRWRVGRAGPDSIGELAELQGRILAAGAAVLAPGGALVYSVCTISRAEGPGVIERFLAGNEEFDVEAVTGRLPEGLRGVKVGPGVQLLPHRDGTDGFFIARLRRYPTS